jgi:hypothetical protein
MKKRYIDHKEKWEKRYPDQYLLICINTGRFAIGDSKKDDQGGHLHASQVFNCKHGAMKQCKESSRTFFGVYLKAV